MQSSNKRQTISLFVLVTTIGLVSTSNSSKSAPKNATTGSISSSPPYPLPPLAPVTIPPESLDPKPRRSFNPISGLQYDPSSGLSLAGLLKSQVALQTANLTSHDSVTETPIPLISATPIPTTTPSTTTAPLTSTTSSMMTTSTPTTSLPENPVPSKIVPLNNALRKVAASQNPEHTPSSNPASHDSIPAGAYLEMYVVSGRNIRFALVLKEFHADLAVYGHTNKLLYVPLNDADRDLSMEIIWEDRVAGMSAHETLDFYLELLPQVMTVKFHNYELVFRWQLRCGKENRKLCNDLHQEHYENSIRKKEMIVQHEANITVEEESMMVNETETLQPVEKDESESKVILATRNPFFPLMSVIFLVAVAALIWTRISIDESRNADREAERHKRARAEIREAENNGLDQYVFVDLKGMDKGRKVRPPIDTVLTREMQKMRKQRAAPLIPF